MSLIRAGHICEIWDVQSTDSGQRVGMKLLPQGEHYTREQIAILKHEYAVGLAFDHECVIKTFDYGSARPGSYIIMELFKHPNLKQRVTRGMEPIAHVIDLVVRRAAEGLAYLHDQGWIHRDVKPDNFLVSDEGEVRLIDFNLAQRRKSGLARILPGKSKVQGTKSYMSPEQIRGQAVDERSDIYSFGCTLFEVVGGRMPFTGTTSNELLNKHLKSKAPPLTAMNNNVTEPFAELIASMLAKKPADRPASVSDILAHLGTMNIFRRRPAAP